MKKNSRSMQALFECISKGWYVKDGELFKNNNEKHKGVYINDCGYFCVTLHPYKKSVRVALHCIVAYQKYGDKIFDTDGRTIHVRHLDGNRLNNLEENIEIGSPSENRFDIPKEMRTKISIKASSYIRKFSDEEVKNIKKDRELGFTYKQLCEKYGTSKSTLSYFFNKALYVK